MRRLSIVYKIIIEASVVLIVALSAKYAFSFVNIDNGYNWILSAALGVFVFASMKIIKFLRINSFAFDFTLSIASFVIFRSSSDKKIEKSPAIFGSVGDHKIYSRLGSAGFLLCFSVISLYIPFFHDIGLIALCGGLALIALADLALIILGMAAHDYGANAAEMEEVLDFLLKQKTKGGGPPHGYRRLFSDDVLDAVKYPAGAGVVAGDR